MSEVKWRFRKMSPSEKNQGTVIGEFFGAEPINTRLAREAIQNSLDAGVDKALGNPAGAAGPVRVRFGLAGIGNPLPAERAARYFTGLAPHLAAMEEGQDTSILSGDVPYIVVEDAALWVCAATGGNTTLRTAGITSTGSFAISGFPARAKGTTVRGAWASGYSRMRRG